MTQSEIQHLDAIKGRVATFDDALRITGKTFLVFEGEEPDDTARRKAKIITEALHTAEDGKKWEADMTNYNQDKYYVWAIHNGFSGFSDFHYVNGYTTTGVGSRFAFASTELALYAGQTFSEIYNIMLK